MYTPAQLKREPFWNHLSRNGHTSRRSRARRTKKTELTKYYLDRGGWDFFAQVFTESHCVGHQCWHLHDSTHPGQPDFASAAGNPVRDVYVAIDSAVGEILSRVNDDTTVIVLAGHGMGIRRGAQFLLHEILVRLDVAVPAAIASQTKSPRFVDHVDTALTWGWRRTPANVKKTVYPLRNRIRALMDPPDRLPTPKLNAAKGKCFLVENHFVAGGIRLNLIGREPHGLVRPGAESDALCDRLQQQLLDICNATTVSRVMRKRDLYQGEYLDHLPDLLVEWSSDMPLGTAVVGKPGTGKLRLHSPDIGLVEGENCIAELETICPMVFLSPSVAAFKQASLPTLFRSWLCADGLKIVGRGSSRYRRQTHPGGSEKRLTDLRTHSKQLLNATTTGTRRAAGWPPHLPRAPRSYRNHL
jgi:Type I phosphodiesterase / nucleotide pyrophosphatase